MGAETSDAGRRAIAEAIFVPIDVLGAAGYEVRLTRVGRPLRAVERLSQVRDEVGRILDPNRQADECLVHSERG